MKKIIPFILFVALAGCAKKEWSKDYIVKKCNKEMQNNKEVNGVVSKDNLEKICDCVAEKMLVKYKSEAEADKDSDGGAEMGRTCALEVLMPGE